MHGPSTARPASAGDSRQSEPVHPYRTAPDDVSTTLDKVPLEEWIVAIFLAALGIALVTITIVQHGPFDVGVTIAGLLGVIGLYLLTTLVQRGRP